MEKIVLTKTKAIELLRNMADEQRDLNWPKVYEYKRLMDYGVFGFREASPLGFCKHNKVKNGQHRIMAFLLSNVEEMEFTVQFENNVEWPVA
jgi:hypothetical protein